MNPIFRVRMLMKERGIAERLSDPGKPIPGIWVSLQTAIAEDAIRGDRCIFA
jgi:hypothetical protein